MATLENFAYGDTPDREALEGLVDWVSRQPMTFEVVQTRLGTELDVRQLVLRTAFTYLELLGVIRQGTPYYAGYSARVLEPVDQIVARFPGERGGFIQEIFRGAKAGRVWHHFDLEHPAGGDRNRVVRALEYMAEQGWLELRAADARQRYTRTADRIDAPALVDELELRFVQRERAEVERIGHVVDLVQHPGCQTAYLRSLAEGHPRALATARRRARFLCGLSSPALSQAKLTGHPLFGSLEDQRFADVLAWCESAGAVGT